MTIVEPAPQPAAVEGVGRRGLAELHTHLGGSVDAAVMWTLAHEQGIALPVKDYWDFVELITVDPRGVEGLPQLDAIYQWTELIQSSPLAVERSVHGAISGAYRKQNITTLEVRFNPMKRNRGGERDLDHIIMAASRGLDRASLEYPQVRAGLILMMDRTFTHDQNEIIVEKAIRYRSRGIVGIDIAGPRPAAAPTPTATWRRSSRRRARPAWDHDPRRRGRRSGTVGRSAKSSSTCGPTGSATASSPRRTSATMKRAPRDGHDPRDLPHLEPPHRRAPGRGRDPRHVPDVRSTAASLHDRDGRARDDADAPPRRARAPAAYRGDEPEDEVQAANERGHEASFLQGRASS